MVFLPTQQAVALGSTELLPPKNPESILPATLCGRQGSQTYPEQKGKTRREEPSEQAPEWLCMALYGSTPPN